MQMNFPTSHPHFFLIAGEASGDLLGARLMHALKKKLDGNVRFSGVGGERMIAEGLDPFFQQSELAHFGIFELFRHIPHILKRIRQAIAEVKHLKPAALITIDAPDFSFRVARKLKDTGIPLIHYVAPTVWAWRPKRAKKIAKFLDHLLVLLPFEPPYFTREGLDCTFVGHSIVESGADHGNAERFRAKYKITDDATLLTVLPGSRRGEITRLMPIFAEAVGKLKSRHPNLHIVIPAAPGFISSLTATTRTWPVPVTITEGDQDKYDGFAASRAAMACSGTIALELAMARLPAVIAYRMNKLTYGLFRRFIKIDYVNLVNLMHDKLIVPELLQENCTPTKLANAVDKLLSDDTARQEQIAGLTDVATWLGQGQFIPSERAAETVLKAIS